jgi:hypothetical protein
MLAKLHEIVVADLDRPGDLSNFIGQLTNALALPQVRLDINTLVHQFRGPAEVVGATRWRQLVPVIGEIVSNIPLTNNAGNNRLKAIAQGMRSTPLRGTSSVIESLVIIPNAQLDRQSQDPRVPYWLELKTPLNGGTVRFLAPLRLN